MYGSNGFERKKERKNRPNVVGCVERGRTNLSPEIGGVGSVVTLCADVKFDKLFVFIAAVAAAAAAILLFDCDEAMLLFMSGTDVTVTTLFDV